MSTTTIFIPMREDTSVDFVSKVDGSLIVDGKRLADGEFLLYYNAGRNKTRVIWVSGSTTVYRNTELVSNSIANGSPMSSGSLEVVGLYVGIALAVVIGSYLIAQWL